MGNHASRDEMLDAFGPFSAIFEPVAGDTPPYLSLLHLHDDNRVATVVELIRDASGKKDSESFLVVLLQDADWRPQLVGAVANCILKFDKATVQMWRAVDAGSWVAPQLLAILSIVDDHFLERSIVRLNSGCPLSEDLDYSVENPIERHVAQGPAASHERSCKAASSLLALLQIDFAKDKHVQEMEQEDELKQLIAEDVDGSGDLATAWRNRILEFVT